MKKFFGVMNFIIGTLGIIFCLNFLFFDELRDIESYFLWAILFLLGIAFLAFLFVTKFWSSTRINAYNFIFPIKIIGYVNLITSLISTIVLILFLVFVKPWEIDLDTEKYFVIISLIFFSISSGYPLVIKFWTFKSIKNKTLQYFRISNSLSLPVVKTKVLLICFLSILFIHLSFFTEKKYDGMTQFQYSNQRIKRIRTPEVTYSGIFPLNTIKLIYLSYLVIFSTLILSVKNNTTNANETIEERNTPNETNH